MGAMEKKRLLSALIIAPLLLSGAVASRAQGPASLEGVRMKPEEAEFRRAKKLLGDLTEPDIAGAKKTLSDMKNNSPGEKYTEQVMKLLSVRQTSEPPFPKKNPASRKEEPALFYFFSFSMPRLSLREAARESAAAGAVMVLRGLSGEDFGETSSRISGLFGKIGAQVWIDPVLFECFSVGSVPQLVLARGYLPGADCGGTRHVKVSGDVSLPHALGLMKKEDSHAAFFIEKLKRTGFYSD